MKSIKYIFVISAVIVWGYFVWNNTYRNDPEKIIENFKNATNELDFERAKRILELNITNKTTYDHFYFYGVALKNTGDLDSAEIYLKESINLDSTKFQPYLRLSEIYMLKSNPELAYSYIKLANNIKEDELDILFQFGDYYTRLKDFENAEYYFTKALNKDPKNSSALSNLGILYLTKKEFGKSEEFLLNALKLIENELVTSKINEHLGLLYFNKNELEVSKGFFETSFNQIFRNENVNYHLGIIYAKEENHAQAIKHYDHAIRARKDDKTYFNRAISYYEIDNFEKAINDLDRAIEVNGQNPEYYVIRGQVKLTIGQNQEGCLDLQKARKLGFKDLTSLIKQYCS